MRPQGRNYVRGITQNTDILEPIYEFGSLQCGGKPELEDLRPLFKGKAYTGCDLRSGPGVDKLMNLEKIELPDESVGTVILVDTLEHVEDVPQAMREVHRILKPHGIVIITSVMLFPIHDFPSDYWRFTPAAFATLLSKYRFMSVEFDGDPKFPKGVYGFGIK